jgi:hypothetical protein
MQKSLDPFGPIQTDGDALKPLFPINAARTSGTLSSPFASTYQTAEADSEYSELDGFTSFVNELHDEELDDGIAELMRYVEESDEIANNAFLENTMPTSGSAGVREEVELLIFEVEEFVGGLANELGTIEADVMSAEEIEAIVDNYRPDFEHGIGSWIKKKVRKVSSKVGGAVKKIAKGAKKIASGARKKAKTIASKVARGAKKAASTVRDAMSRVAGWAKKMGLGKLLKLILARVKQHIGPFIRLALCAAMEKVPKSLRRHAEKLRKRVGKWFGSNEVGIEPETGGAAAFDAALVDPSDIQHDLNQRLASLIYGELDDETGWEARIDRYRRLPESAEVDRTIETFNQARSRFVREIVEEETENYAPHVEEFIGTIWPVLKGAITVGGRKRIVDFVSRKLVAPLIMKLFAKGGKSGRKLGKIVAKPLGSAITSSGLRLMGLELNEDDKLDAAGQMMAATVEDLVHRVVAMPDEVLDDDVAMEGLVLEAFEAAAAANLPQMLPEQIYESRPELRESKRHKGCWLTLPIKSQRKSGRALYKKYSTTPEVTLDEETLKRVRTGCGRPLKFALQKRLSRRLKDRVRARMHLYEAIPGTTDARLRAHESLVDDVDEDFELHPLTPEAASMLLGDARLGREVSMRNRCHRRRMGVGQRLYRLELLDEPVSEALVGTDDEIDLRSIETNVIFDFPKETVTVSVFVDETEIAEIAQRLAQPGADGIVLARLRVIYQEGLQRALSGTYPGHAHIIHGALSPDQARGEAFGWLPVATTRAMAVTLSGWVGRSLLELMRDDPRMIMNAAASPRYGATFTTQILRPSGLSRLYRALDGQLVRLYDLLLEQGYDRISATVVPGFYRA